MGYYIEIVNSTAKIKKEHLEKAYEVACELNNHDELKTGGSYSGGKCTGKDHVR